jgi:hypothetical protein
MKANGLLSATLILIATLAPVRTLGQSQNSTDEIRELRKLVEEMRAQMGEMQAEIAELKGTRPKASAQPATAPTVSATPQEGTIEAAPPPLEGTLSPQVGKPRQSAKNLVRTRLQPHVLTISLLTRSIPASLNCLERKRF